MEELLCLTNEGWSGVVEALRTTIKVLDKGKLVTVNSSMLSCANAARTILNNPPSVLIVGGYGEFFRTIISKVSKKSKVIVLWCSNVLQSELTGEMDQLNMTINMLRDGTIYGLAFIEMGSYAAMKRAFPTLNFMYLPVVPVERAQQPKIILDPDKFHVDIFCTPDGRKNIYNQMLAYVDIAQVHVNYGKPSYASMAANFPNVVNHGRLSLEALDQYSASVNLCSQVSANESFDYVAADHMFLGTPVLASQYVPAICECTNKLIHKYLIVQDFASTAQISSKVAYLKGNKTLRMELGQMCKEDIRRIAEERSSVLIEEIAKVTR